MHYAAAARRKNDTLRLYGGGFLALPTPGAAPPPFLPSAKLPIIRPAPSALHGNIQPYFCGKTSCNNPKQNKGILDSILTMAALWYARTYGAVLQFPPIVPCPRLHKIRLRDRPPQRHTPACLT
jgi:hypothetical protein